MKTYKIKVHAEILFEREVECENIEEAQRIGGSYIPLECWGINQFSVLEATIDGKDFDVQQASYDCEEHME